MSQDQEPEYRGYSKYPPYESPFLPGEDKLQLSFGAKIRPYLRYFAAGLCFFVFIIVSIVTPYIIWGRLLPLNPSWPIGLGLGVLAIGFYVASVFLAFQKGEIRLLLIYAFFGLLGLFFAFIPNKYFLGGGLILIILFGILFITTLVNLGDES